MLVTIIPNTKQIKRFAESALNGFEDLSNDNAVENARCELQSLLSYLNGLQNADDAVCESFISRVESGVELEFCVANPDRRNSV